MAANPAGKVGKVTRSWKTLGLRRPADPGPPADESTAAQQEDWLGPGARHSPTGAVLLVDEARPDSIRGVGAHLGGATQKGAGGASASRIPGWLEHLMGFIEEITDRVSCLNRRQGDSSRWGGCVAAPSRDPQGGEGNSMGSRGMA